MSLQPGTRLGPYEIVSAIGIGGMGEVYKAKDTRLDRTVAIKVLPSDVSSDPALRERFEREARTIAALNHPHICTLHDVRHQDGVDYLVLEYLEGQTLAERLTKSALPLDQALAIAVQIADALDKAHRAGIVHRDLKPGNIMLTRTGAKLLDFGLAKASPAVGLTSLSNRIMWSHWHRVHEVMKVLDFGLAKLTESSPTSLSGPNALSMSPTITSPALATGVGVLLGTAAYMSPEQAKGKPADKRSDIWAFGCVLYEMLSGKRAFAGDDVSETLASVLAREPDWTALPTTVAPAIHTILRRSLEKDRRKRVADIRRHGLRSMKRARWVRLLR
jgi:eukaryotic-like serine/threonine-protein kinase